MKISTNSVAILGYHDGSAGQIETWFEAVTGYNIACFVHEADQLEPINIVEENKKRVSQRIEFPINGRFKKRPLIVSLRWWEVLLELGINKVLPLTPNNLMRERQINQCHKVGIQLVSAIHPTVTILPEAEISDGVWINANSVIGYKVEIAEGCILNTGCQIDHHNILRSCAQLAPGVVSAGNVTFGRCSDVYTGAVIINRINLGQEAIVGAGAVVIRNIPDYSMVVGNPAKIIKHAEPSNTCKLVI